MILQARADRNAKVICRYDECYDYAARAVSELKHALSRRTDVSAAYLRAQAAIEATPLPRGDFEIACKRLQNAFIYFTQREMGAAVYELNLLGTSLKFANVRQKE